MKKVYCTILTVLLFFSTLAAGGFPENYSDWNFSGDFFVFHDNSFTTDDAAKLKYAPEFRNVSGKRLPSLDTTQDFNRLFGYSSAESRRIAIAVNQIDVKKSGRIQLGVGADWHIFVFIDGKKVFDTFELGGNGSAPAKKDNHIIDVELTAGRHTVTFWISSGATTWTVAAGKNPYLKVRYPVPGLQYGPYLVNTGSRSSSIVFAASEPVPAGVRIRKSGAKEFRDIWNATGYQIDLDKKMHRIDISGLEPECCYEYQLIMLERPENKLVILPEKYSLTTTAERFKPFKIFLTSDLQYINDKQRDILNKYLALPHAASSQLFVSVGDTSGAYNDFAYAMFATSLEAVTRLHNSRKNLLLVRGNHEYRGICSRTFAELFHLDNGKTYGLYCWNNVAFLIIDSGNGGGASKANTRHSSAYDLMPELLADQRKVISQAVNSQAWKTAKYRVVLAHGAVYGSGGKLENFTRKIIENILDPSEIHLWIAGHIHRYRRTVPGRKGFYGFSPAKKIDYPYLDGQYRFTTLITDGPGVAKPHSGHTIEFLDNAIEVKSFFEDGKAFDTFQIAPDGSLSNSAPGKELIFFDLK